MKILVKPHFFANEMDSLSVDFDKANLDDDKNVT